MRATASKRRVGVRPIVALAGITISLMILAIGTQSRDARLTTAAVALLATVSVGLYWSDRRRSFALVGFTVTFVLFLQGRQLINAIAGTPDDSPGVLGTGASSVDVLDGANIALFTALVGLLSGWSIALLRGGNSVRPAIDVPTLEDSNRLATARKVSALLLVLCTPFSLYVTWLTASQVTAGDFYEARLTTSVSLPLRIAEALFHISFFAFLAGRPSRRGAGWACGLYVVVAATTLATLARNEFLLSVCIVVMYLYYRQVTYGERWFTLGRTLPAALLSPLLLALLNRVGSLRGREAEGTEGFFSPVFDFIRSQGVSVKVLVGASQYGDRIPEEKFYSFGPIIEFLLKVTGRGGGDALSGQSATRALEGHQFAHTISYLISPVDYLRGTGYGSSAVAELLVDFGFIGVLGGFAAYGYLLSRAWLGLSGSFPVTLLTLMLLKGVLFVPRASFVQPLVDPFSVPSLVALAMLFVILQSLWRTSPAGTRNRPNPSRRSPSRQRKPRVPA